MSCASRCVDELHLGSRIGMPLRWLLLTRMAMPRSRALPRRREVRNDPGTVFLRHA